MRYLAVYAGDTGGDHGIFDGGTYATVEEAVEAVKKGLESCYCHAAFGYVADAETNTILVVFDGSGEIVHGWNKRQKKRRKPQINAEKEESL